VLAVIKPNRITRKCTDANYSSFHLRVFLGLTNPLGHWQTSTISILCGNIGERKAMFKLDMSRTTQMQLYKCIQVP
jgi:polyferredoxin